MVPSHESESKHALRIFDSIPSLIHTGRPDGYLDFFNQTWLCYLGRSLEDLQGWKWTAFIHADDVEGILEKWRASVATGEPFLHEARVRRADGEYRWMLHHKVAVRDESGKIIKWHGSSIDIEDRKRAEQALQSMSRDLQESKAKLEEAQRITHVGYWEWNLTTDRVNWSDETYRIYGLRPQERPMDLAAVRAKVHPEDWQRGMEEALRGDARFNAECRVFRPTGEVRIAHFQGDVKRDASGRPNRMFGTVQDITDRKRAEDALRKTETELREVIDTIPALVLSALPDGSNHYTNSRFTEYSGMSAEQMAGSGWKVAIHPDDLPEHIGKWMASVASGEPLETELRFRRVDGQYRWHLVRGVPLRDEDGNIIRWYGVSTDIEDHKRAEEAIRRSEAYLREAQRLSHTGSFGWRPDSGEIVWSDETYRIFEYDCAVQPTIDLVVRRVHPEDRALAQQVIDRASQTGTDFEHEYRLLLPDGRVKYVHSVAHALQDASGNREFVGAVTDVTESKETEHRIHRIINTVPGLHWSARPDGWVDFINQRWLDYTGMKLEQAVGWGWTPAYHPDEIEEVKVTWRTALAEGKPLEMETRLRRFDGEYRWFLERVFPLFDSAGQILGWYGSDIDIHDRKLAEEALRQQEMELRQMLDFTPQLVSVYGAGRERIHANLIQLDYLGIGLDEWRQKSPGIHIHPDDFQRVNAYWDRALGSGSGFDVELRVRKHDGSYRWFLARYNPVRDDKGQIMRWYVAGTDIEDRKRAEEKLQQENAALREEIDRTSMFEEIVGTSSALKNVLLRISKVAPSDSTVLITGETGTGKELVARAIHRRSQRSGRAFASVNCAAIPRDLIASELFGHEKGAFTGALQRRLGRFEMADRGTIFLDEVGELSPDTQVALLRVLQEREFERVGGGRPIRVDVRVIAATNRDLKAAVANGTFRQDLFYRLNVFPIEAPPLRERTDDTLMLVEYFVQRYATRAGKHFRSIDKRTLELLQSYDWPGNIRELQNVIERSVILGSGDVFSIDESWLAKETSRPATRVQAPAVAKRELEPLSEREVIEAALAETRGRVSGTSGAAAKLAIPASTLNHRIKALKINKRLFKFR